MKMIKENAIIILDESKSESNPELIVQTGIDSTSPCSIGIVFFVTLNNTSDVNDYDVELTPDKCCLVDDINEDCDILRIVGTCRAFLPKSRTKTLKLVAPILDPFEREGYCDVYLDSKLNQQRNKRDILQINFDTIVQNNDEMIRIKRCPHKDEDPLNDCNPVNCEMFYNGRKTHYNRSLKKCVHAPACITIDDVDYPELIYNPLSNKCEKRSVTENDIHVIKSYINDNNRKVKDIIMLKNNATNFSTDDIDAFDVIDFDTTTAIDTASKKIKTIENIQNKFKNKCLKILLLNYLRSNKWILMILGLVILIQCIFICSMMYCMTKRCDCFKDKKVVRKFFNYRQDASVTTPLIGTSNMETETIDFQYLSESSTNRDQKIKCYKACQKERPEIMKQSMSDDILSKCLNRRNWKNHYNSNVISEVHNISNEKEEFKKPEIQKTICCPGKSTTKESKKPVESRVVFEDQKSNTTVNKPKVVTIVSNTEIIDTGERSSDIIEIKSERELTCHSYECFDANMTETKLKPLGKSELFKSDKVKDSIPTEKGAQAYFPNDSVEDFLSERGVMDLANDNLSKFTFSCDSNESKQLASSLSSKTSKNFFKHVFTLLRKRSKQGPLSDPGKSKNLDLEILHMSRASVYSSSNESDCIKNLKAGESRTSF